MAGWTCAKDLPCIGSAAARTWRRPVTPVSSLTNDIGKSLFSIGTTPRKINIEPENDGLEDDVPFPGVYSQVPC